MAIAPTERFSSKSFFAFVNWALIFLYVVGLAYDFPNLYFTTLTFASLFLLRKALKPRLNFQGATLAKVSVTAIVLSTIICGALKKMGISDEGVYGNDLKALFFVLILAPFEEETFYRFTLWLPFERRFPLPIVITITSFMFAFSHVWTNGLAFANNHKFLTAQFIFTFVFAMIVGSINAKTKSLMAAFSAHACANLGAIIGFRVLF